MQPHYTTFMVFSILMKPASKCLDPDPYADTHRCTHSHFANRFNSMVATRRRWNVGYFALWLCPGRRKGGMKSRDPEKLYFIIKSIENKGICEEKSWDLEFHKETNHIYIRWYSQSCPISDTFGFQHPRCSAWVWQWTFIYRPEIPPTNPALSLVKPRWCLVTVTGRFKVEDFDGHLSGWHSQSGLDLARLSGRSKAHGT